MNPVHPTNSHQNTEFLSPATITALAEVISGEARRDDGSSMSRYVRSARQIQQFMMVFGIDFSDHFPRLPKLRKCLESLQKQSDSDKLLFKIVERALDPQIAEREHRYYEENLEYLNRFLRNDGFEVRISNDRARLYSIKQDFVVSEELQEEINRIDFNTVISEIERARTNIENDPETTITAACALLESLFRSIIIELGSSLPNDKTVISLYKEIQRPLGFTDDEGKSTILKNLTALVQGLGTYRTQKGSAHGRERGYKKPRPSEARLAINSANAVATFVLEIWHEKYPKKELHSSTSD
jgi:hypothetical protein